MKGRTTFVVAHRLSTIEPPRGSSCSRRAASSRWAATPNCWRAAACTRTCTHPVFGSTEGDSDMSTPASTVAAPPISRFPVPELKDLPEDIRSRISRCRKVRLRPERVP